MAGLEKCSNGYCEVPGGSFQMGSMDRNSDAHPMRDITMTGFQLGQMEVSVGDFARTFGTQLEAVISGCSSGSDTQSLLGKTGETASALFTRALQIFISNSCSKIEITKSIPNLPDLPQNKRGDNYPAVDLTFDKKRAYCQAQGGDLPTAAQLHYASRFDDQDSTVDGRDQRVIWDNGFRSIEPVDGGYKNRFGLYNLLGNVWESALDAYDQDFYPRMESTDPYNPMTDQVYQSKEFSGGDLYTGWRPDARSSGFNKVGEDLGNVGFRCARPLPQNSKK